MMEKHPVAKAEENFEYYKDSLLRVSQHADNQYLELLLFVNRFILCPEDDYSSLMDWAKSLQHLGPWHRSIKDFAEQLAYSAEILRIALRNERSAPSCDDTQQPQP